ncbi:MAG: DNA alkylation repair protein [Deltaproteobacteria bacterium]|nr:DNA alkylation repair protein [Candidatus Zymogenaceae bacterium]
MKKSHSSDHVSSRVEEIVARLLKMADGKSAAGMSRVGIDPARALGVKVPGLRALGKEIGTDHELALALWKRGLRETMILASLVADPKQTTGELMESWASDFYDWEVCDQTCMNLFEKPPLREHVYSLARQWSERAEEFVKRAGFVLMARLAVSDKKAPDDAFSPFFEDIVREASDERNMVKKGINWALRQIGKRNLSLRDRAVETANTLRERDSSAARWIAADALRELNSKAVVERLKEKEKRK